MWPFSQLNQYALPPWSYMPIERGRFPIRVRPGQWAITDGAVLGEDAITFGEIITDDACLAVEYGMNDTDCNELASVELIFSGRSSNDDVFCRATPPKRVVDSGQIVVCNIAAFSRISESVSSRCAFARYARDKYRSVDVIGVSDVSGHVIGVVVKPPYGDGSYSLEAVDNVDRHVVIMMS